MKRLTSFILCAIMVLLAAVPAAGQGNNYYGVTYYRDLYKNLAFSDISSSWAKESIYKMAALGVVKGYGGKFLPNGQVSKQQAITMLVGLMGQQAQAAAMGANTGATFNNRDAWAEGYLNYAMSQGIITPQEKAQNNWRGIATRQEVAYWMAKSLGFQPIYGAEQQAVYSFADSKKFDYDKIPYCEPILANRIMTGRSTNLFQPTGSITRAELCSVLERAAQYILPQRQFTTLQGTVVYIDGATGSGIFTGQVWNTQQVIFHLAAATGQDFSLVKDLTTSYQRDFLVIKGGIPGNSDRLAVGDNVEVLLNEKNEIVWVQVAAQGTPSAMYVTLESVDLANKTISVKAPNSQLTTTIAIAPNYSVSLDGYPGTLQDLIAGQQLTLYLSGTQVKQIHSSLSYFNPFNQPVGDNLVEYGTLLYKSSTELEVRDDDYNKTYYKITPQTTFIRNNRIVEWHDLQAGDYLKIYLASYNSHEAYKVQVTGETNAVNAVYRGKIQTIDTASDRITFSDVSKYEGGRWNSNDDLTSMLIADDAQLYHGDQRLRLDTLKGSYTGYYCYFATSTTYGENRIVKLTLKVDNEYKYSGKIYSVNTNLNAMTVDQVSAQIQYDEGTIVVRDGKLVEPDSLATNLYGVFFINEVRKGINQDIVEKHGKVIIVESITEPALTIYRGQIEAVRSNYMDINMYSIIADNEFDRERSTSADTRIDFNDDTGFLDASDAGNVREISKDKFLDDGLAGEYDHCLVYVIADGDTALAVLITGKINDDLDNRDYTNERISYGEISEKAAGSSTVTLTNVKDWDGYSDEWTLQGSIGSFNTDKCVIVKDKVYVSSSRLEVGDKLYMLRSGQQPLLIIVQ